MNIFPEPKFVFPEWRCCKAEVTLYLSINVSLWNYVLKQTQSEVAWDNSTNEGIVFQHFVAVLYIFESSSSKMSYSRSLNSQFQIDISLRLPIFFEGGGTRLFSLIFWAPGPSGSLDYSSPFWRTLPNLCVSPPTRGANKGDLGQAAVPIACLSLSA